MNNTIEKKLIELGLEMPTLPASKGIYKRCLTIGSLVYVSGHVSVKTDGSYIIGKLGKDMDEEQGKIAAQQCGLGMLASLKLHLGDLDKVKRVVKILGMVNATPEYDKHPLVINGCSDLYAQLWGIDNGIGVRSAVGMGSLPNNVAVEIEAIFEIQKRKRHD
jgi:enamine deaminase RidA (YjgF/YER057c/UK114 family)